LSPPGVGQSSVPPTRTTVVWPDRNPGAKSRRPPSQAANKMPPQDPARLSFAGPLKQNPQSWDTIKPRRNAGRAESQGGSQLPCALRLFVAGNRVPNCLARTSLRCLSLEQFAVGCVLTSPRVRSRGISSQLALLLPAGSHSPANRYHSGFNSGFAPAPLQSSKPLPLRPLAY
jgi:hypothetical protein